jgi:RNA polymerase sigma-70 factor, ECF subfamily
MVAELGIFGATSATLVAEAAAGDAFAFARIVAAYHDDMARVCYVICGDPELAQDAVQSAWPIAWRKLGTLRDPERLRPWLVTIAAREARHMARAERRHRVVDTEVTNIGSSQGDPGAWAGTADLAAALRRLGADDRQVLALRYIAGFDATEIGRSLGLSASGVRSRLARAVERLRKELGDD